MLVDLPGYGYRRGAEDQGQAPGPELVHDLSARPRRRLRRVCLLIDARHGLKDNDREIMEMLDKAAVPYQIVLTKIRQGEEGRSGRRAGKDRR